MADDPASAADHARRVLTSLGLAHAVGTSWNAKGKPVVVVDLPPGVDKTDVAGHLGAVGTEVVIRNLTRRIVAQGR